MWFIRLCGAGWACGPDLRGNLGLMGLGSGSHCLLSAGRSIWLPMRRGTIAAAPIEIKRLGQTIKKELGARPDKNRPKDAKEINRSPLSDYQSVNVLVLTWLGCALQFRARPRPPGVAAVFLISTHHRTSLTSLRALGRGLSIRGAGRRRCEWQVNSSRTPRLRVADARRNLVAANPTAVRLGHQS
jgi:hypothetical protein